MRKALLGVLCLLGVLVGITWYALEKDGVIAIETQRPDGSVRTTHVWWIEEMGQLWLEAGSPTNGWFLDTEAGSPVVVHWPDGEREYATIAVRGVTNHEWIRRMIRQKYGWRDWWINRIVDTSESIAVHLRTFDAMQSKQ